MIACRTLNLFSPEPLVALQVLIAMRARKLELAHDIDTVSGAKVSAIAELIEGGCRTANREGANSIVENNM
jgi:hypothetical protein